MTESTQDELYLVDGSGFIFRAYYAMAYSGRSPMTTEDGTPVSAVFGYTQMIIKMLKDYNAPHMAVIFDAARKNFRNEIYADYKANRDDTPEDLKPQFAIIREATEAFDIPAIDLEGYEADDLIAAYTKLALANGLKVVIVSSDKDLMQLVGDGVRMLDPMKGKFIDEDAVQEKFGVLPNRVVDVQALAGDTSDNVPGVPGIGIKTAAALINEYGDLDALLARASEIKQPKRREALIENAELARISRQLVKLDEDAPVPVPLDALKTHDPEKPELVAFLQKYKFKSILSRLGVSTDVIPAQEGIQEPEALDSPNKSGNDDVAIKDNIYTLINDEATLQSWIDEAYKIGTICIDTETTALTPAKAKLVGISIASTVGKAAYIPLGHTKPQADLLGETHGDDTPQLDKARVIEMLKPALEDAGVLKIAHNMKYDWQMLAKEGVYMSPCDDTMLISYVLDGTQHSHSMDNLSKLYFDHEPIKFEEVAGKGKKAVTFDLVTIEKALDYAAEDADVTLRLHKLLKPRLAAEKMLSVYENIERPLIPVIAQMELAGIKVDVQALNDMSHDFGKKLAALETDIHALAGESFNIASPKQVGGILFGKLGLKGGKKTKTGDWSTSAPILEKLASAEDAPEIVGKILEHRQLSKLKSTYSDALQAQINPDTGRVHTSFSMAHVNTGRLSSSDPNLQNIPIRTEEGRKIREAFIAAPGHTLLAVDYSQVELRLAAALAGIEKLKQAFKDGVDIHALTAAQVFDLPLEAVTPDIRRQAKAVNFGIIYGISRWGLAKQLSVSADEAGDFIDRYLARFPELNDYMEAKKEEARTQGFIKTLYGRKCVISGINDKNGAIRAFAERQAINAPLQGTAADIMKIAMARVKPALEKAGLKAKMLLQVHDELVFEVPDAELEATSTLVKQIMTETAAATVDVPLEAEAGSGTSWAEAH